MKLDVTSLDGAAAGSIEYPQETLCLWSHERDVVIAL